ncbi:unnamed protein product [Cuscuta epithymum]|uniref:Uncharacterized protein n=1 Tax=Cuscuta epithymum TaxID=186058 RepID=A0AAV0FSZ7_9ASTE|nr:unnamed protein product [Cuscuta epithymum]
MSTMKLRVPYEDPHRSGFPSLEETSRLHDVHIHKSWLRLELASCARCPSDFPGEKTWFVLPPSCFRTLINMLMDILLWSLRAHVCPVWPFCFKQCFPLRIELFIMYVYG